MFYLLRRLERWLHQHIFKVGWLLTKKLQTTTILYYTFFLPGVVLHEAVYWFVAGILNVRAERAFAWPEAQAVGELRLNFIRLARNTGTIKLAVISTAPLIVGVLLVWHITNSILLVDSFLADMQNGTLTSLSSGIGALTAAPDFWLWVYITFTIANTMMPNVSDLKGWRRIVITVAVIAVILFLLGVGDEVVLRTIAVPAAGGATALATMFAVIIAIDLFTVGVLGALESIIERITGDSATFKDGKMITMRREELLKLREQEQAKRSKQQAKRPRAPAGPPSVYKLPFPIPDAPGRDTASEPITVRREESPALSAGRPPELQRASPAVIPTNRVTTPEPAAEPISHALLDDDEESEDIDVPSDEIEVDSVPDLDVTDVIDDSDDDALPPLDDPA